MLEKSQYLLLSLSSFVFKIRIGPHSGLILNESSGTIPLQSYGGSLVC